MTDSVSQENKITTLSRAEYENGIRLMIRSQTNIVDALCDLILDYAKLPLFADIAKELRQWWKDHDYPLW